MEAGTYWDDIGSRARRRVLFAPSLLGADPLCVGAALDGLGGRYDWLHLDIMDGHFVRNLSFGPAMARALRRRYPDAFIDAHLMVDRLDVLLPLFVDAEVASGPALPWVRPPAWSGFVPSWRSRIWFWSCPSPPGSEGRA